MVNASLHYTNTRENKLWIVISCVQLILEQIKNLEMITDQQEDENSKLKDQLDDAEDKMKGMQTTLDSGYQ